MNSYVRPTAASPISRRTMLMSGGVTALALAGLSACGDTAPTPGASSAAAPAGVTAKTADIPVGGGKIFTEAQAVVTQPKAGEFKAFSSICTHQNCPVTQVTATINCACHGSQFALADGAVVTGPATTPLPARTVTVDGDSLSIA